MVAAAAAVAVAVAAAGALARLAGSVGQGRSAEGGRRWLLPTAVRSPPVPAGPARRPTVSGQPAPAEDETGGDFHFLRLPTVKVCGPRGACSSLLAQYARQAGGQSRNRDGTDDQWAAEIIQHAPAFHS